MFWAGRNGTLVCAAGTSFWVDFARFQVGKSSRKMNKYKVVKTLGEGSFGSVFEAQNTKSKEKVLVFFCTLYFLPDR